MGESREKLAEIHRKYWGDEFAAPIIAGIVERHAFAVDLVISEMGAGVKICDLGAGWGAFAAGCAAMGMDATMVDDYCEPGYFNQDDIRLKMPDEYGVTTVKRDLVREGLDFEPESYDVITSFDSMEHWHHSPKQLFSQIMDVLRPGGLFLLGVPNCVNLRKRVTVPFGYGKWSSMEDWYETPDFRGHVREPDVDDLRYIARDMGLSNVKIVGRNWQGLSSPSGKVRAITKLVDPFIRPFPSLCSDIYLLGRKP